VVTDRADMTLRSPVALKCLAGPRRPFDHDQAGRPFDHDQAEALDIDPPSDDFAKQVVEAGIQVAQNIASDAPDPTLPTGEEGQAELAALCDALKRENPRQAERLEGIGGVRPEPDRGGRHGRHSAKIDRLVRAGVAGWAEDVRGWFAGNGDRAILVQADTGFPIVDEPGGRYFHVPKTARPTVAFPMTEFIAHLESVEGLVSHMYQDSAEEPNVTIGIGTNLTAQGGGAAAVSQLLDHATVRATGVDATAQEIRNDFAAVAAQPGGNLAGWYEDFTTLDIDDATARRLAEDFTRRAVAALVAGDDFPDFNRTPATAQMGLMDLLYTLGPDGLVNTFTRFSSAYNGRDWKGASQQAFRGSVSDTRDNTVSGWFQDLAAGHRFFILWAVKPGSGISIEDFDESTPKFSPRSFR
jgi:hypothetical protein